MSSTREAADEAFSSVGRLLYGPTEPGQGARTTRETPLTAAEIDEVVLLIADARERHLTLSLPVELRTRHWGSITAVMLALDTRRGLTPVGWKIGAASKAVQDAEGMPEPSPGRLYAGSVFESGSRLEPSLFINYRNNECEFAFVMAQELPPREDPYTEAEVEAAVESMFLALEIGDSVFEDWYGASGYLGSSLDNGGGAALVRSAPIREWRDIDLPATRIDVYLNDTFIKSGFGEAAMGHPLTSLTWLVNWLRERGMTLAAGEIVSTGTCTGHLFVARGDHVKAVFADIGEVEVHYN